jgi:hypothetical protein
VLLLTVLYWPVSWLVRRRYAAPIAVTGHALKAYRATRIMALLVLAVLGGWMAAITVLFGDISMLTASADTLLWFLQISGAIIFVGMVGIAAWNAWLTWRGGRGWARKIWSVIVVGAGLIVLYTASAYSLLAMTVNY